MWLPALLLVLLLGRWVLLLLLACGVEVALPAARLVVLVLVL
jgi:hypothetical protein